MIKNWQSNSVCKKSEIVFFGHTVQPKGEWRLTHRLVGEPTCCSHFQSNLQVKVKELLLFITLNNSSIISQYFELQR